MPTAPLLHRDDPAKDPLIGNVKVTRQDWLNAALDVMLKDGVERVKILTLADRLGVSRSSFYWYFKDRKDILNAILDQWQATNTAALVARTQAPAKTITAAVCNVFHCVVDSRLFNDALDFAVRDWAKRSEDVRLLLDASDKTRLDALQAMFARFGYVRDEARTRALVLYYMQIGYNLADLNETIEERIAQVPNYLRVFTGQDPQPGEVEAFADHARGVAEELRL